MTSNPGWSAPPSPDQEASPPEEVRDWEMGTQAQIVASVLGLVVIVGALIGFAMLFSIANGVTSGTFGAAELGVGSLVTLLATVILVVLHEGIHGLVILAYGGRPTFGVGRAGIVPYFYATADAQLLSRGQFAVVAQAPTVLVTALCAGLVMLPFGSWLVVASALVLAGCVGDWMLTWVALRAPKGSLIEDRKTGVRIHLSGARGR